MSAFYFTALSPRACRESPFFTLRDKQSISATLSSNQLFAIPLLQHRFHFIQSIHGGAHLRLINDARSFSIHDLALKIHLHLTLFLGDHSLNDRRGFLRNAVSLS